MIVNVSSTHAAITSSQLSRHKLLSWVNTTLHADFTKVEELCTGAAYCQLMHSLRPDFVPIRRVKYCTNTEYDFINNFKILQTVFEKLQVQKAIPINRLVRGKFQDNIEFLQWFKKFYDANCDVNQSYDALAVRNGRPMALDSPALKKRSKMVSPRAGSGAQLRESHRQEPISKNVENEEGPVLKRSPTRTELRHNHQAPTNSVKMATNQTSTPKFELGFQDLEPKADMPIRYMTHSDFKLNRILAYCLEAYAAGKASFEIVQIMGMIYADPYSK